MDRPFTDIEVIDNVVEDSFSDYLIHRFRQSSNWHYDPEYGMTGSDGIHYPQHPADDTGVTIPIYRKDKPKLSQKSEDLYSLCHYPISQFFIHSKYLFSNPVIYRVYANAFNSRGRGILHKDMPGEEKFHTFVYLMNSCDGGTVFECPDAIKQLGTNIVHSVAGRFVSFPSDLYEHYGSGSGKDKQRFSLNVIFSYDDIQLKT